MADQVTVLEGDCRDHIKGLQSGSIDSVVTDPPYALVSIVKRFGAVDAAAVRADGPTGVYARASAGFMGKRWDTGETAFDPAFWVEVLRVLKPGGHLIAFGGTRTYHRLACAIEDAGFEIRDMVAWMYGSGFPKSHNVSKGIDRSLGAERETVRVRPRAETSGTMAGSSDTRPWIEKSRELGFHEVAGGTPITAAAAAWQGWGTALKPALEPTVLARKPLGSRDIDVRGIVEQQLRQRGVEGEIQWNSESASAAAKRKMRPISLSTEALPAEATSADGVGVSETESAGTRTAKDSEQRQGNGPKTIVSARGSCANEQTDDSGIRFFTPTAEDAPAVAKPSAASSLLTTSTEAEPPTEGNTTKKSMRSSADKDSQPDTESFAGIATGLTGSMERVHISRHAGGFKWPDGLPERVPSRPLTVAANVLMHGTGALNIEACRVGEREESQTTKPRKAANGYGAAPGGVELPPGRWPANVIHDGSAEVLAGFPDTGLSSGGSGAASQRTALNGEVYGQYSGATLGQNAGGLGDSGSAARFFYTAKADSGDRLQSKHPTVKPVDLMAWLIKLVTPPGGLVLDPFAGSGTTGMAAMREGFRAVLIEREAEYVADIKRRIAHVRGEDTPLFSRG